MSAIIKLLSKFDDSGIRAAKKGFSGLTKTLGAVGIGLGLGQIANYATNAVKGFEQAEIASSKLANVMKSMGVADATKRVDAYAESLQDLTAVDADVIKAAQTKLATFKNLTATVDVAGGAFDRATKATLDLAAAGFGSAESNAVQLGKALNDPVKGLSALTRSGITFTAQEKDKIKQLVATNKTLEAQDLILQAIETQVGGTAEAGVSVFDKMNRSMESVSDEVGKILLPYMKDFSEFLLNDVIPNVKSFLKDLSNPDTEAGKTFLQIKKAVEDTYNGVKDFFALFGNGDAMKGFGNIASSLVQMLPALLALKSIMMLASAGKSIANLAKAIGLMTGANAVGDGTSVIGGGKGKKGGGKMPLLGGGALLGLGMVLSLSGDTMNNEPKTAEEIAAWKKQDKINKANAAKNYGKIPGLISQQPVTNNITINVQKADPKATVDALGKYIKQNGSLPYNFNTKKVGG
jgi:hypothetical protein